MFNRKAEKILGFLIAYRLYIKMRMREATIEKQIQWMLSYVQEGLADICKENILEDLKIRIVEYTTVGEFLVDLKEEFGKEDEETMKVAELKKVKQGSRTMEDFVQEFRRVARGSRYKGRPLIKEFKREINRMIRRKLMEVERPLKSIEWWYKRVINLDRY